MPVAISPWLEGDGGKDWNLAGLDLFAAAPNGKLLYCETLRLGSLELLLLLAGTGVTLLWS